MGGEFTLERSLHGFLNWRGVTRRGVVVKFLVKLDAVSSSFFARFSRNLRRTRTLFNP